VLGCSESLHFGQAIFKGVFLPFCLDKGGHSQDFHIFNLKHFKTLSKVFLDIAKKHLEIKIQQLKWGNL